MLRPFKTFCRKAPTAVFNDGLRARTRESCIRMLTSVNNEALEACDDDVLKKLGCQRGRDDTFHYEVKLEEVKL